MEIIHVTASELHHNLANGGGLEFLFSAEEGSKHYVWDGNMFVKGECAGIPSVGVPILTRIPHLLHIMEVREKTGVEPNIYASSGFGIGIIFPNVV